MNKQQETKSGCKKSMRSGQEPESVSFLCGKTIYPHNDYSSETSNNTSCTLYSICLIVWCMASKMYEEKASREVYTVGMKDS